MIDSRHEFPSDEEYNAEVAELMEMYERIKRSLVYNNLVVKKDTVGITIQE